MYDYGAKLIAARKRHLEGATWADVAAEINAGERTVRGWDADQDEEWVKACDEVVAEMKREGYGAAWRVVVKAIKSGDVTSAFDVIKRVEGAVTQRHELSGPNGGPLQTEAKVELTADDHLGEVARILAECGALQAPDQAAPEAEDDEVHPA